MQYITISHILFLVDQPGSLYTEVQAVQTLPHCPHLEIWDSEISFLKGVKS